MYKERNSLKKERERERQRNKATLIFARKRAKPTDTLLVQVGSIWAWFVPKQLRRISAHTCFQLPVYGWQERRGDRERNEMQTWAFCRQREAFSEGKRCESAKMFQKR